VYVRTPTGSATVSPPRSVLLADSGCPPRPQTIGSGFWLCRSSSRITRFSVFAACSAAARGSLAGYSEVGWASRPPEDSTTWPNRPSWKCSVTVRVWWKRTSIPS
jgi:hypothetical protein